MRPKKRLQFTRFEDADGSLVYRAKRKREMALITPSAQGGYDVTYIRDKQKQRVVTTHLAEAKECCEAMRSIPRRNPLPSWMTSPGAKRFWIGAGLGAAVAAVATLLVQKSAAAASSGSAGSTGASGTTPAPLVPSPGTPAAATTTEAFQLTTDDTQSFGWDGKSTVSLVLPPGATGWVSVTPPGGAASSVTGTAAATGALQLPNPPTGTWTIVYADPATSTDPTGYVSTTVVISVGA